MRHLVLKAREEKRLRHGHLWIFSNEVDVRQSPLTDFAPGEQVIVRAASGQEMGVAYVNPASLICGRLVSYDSKVSLDETLLRQRLQAALELRERIFTAPYYRLCHGEGDWLPGLIIDRYDNVLAVQLTTAGMDVLKDTIIKVLVELLQPSCIALRNDIPSRDLEHLPRVNEDVLGLSPTELTVPENGVTFSIPFAQGQKTGWFYDQGRNHAEAARYARGASVLDAFCYAGGFGVTAAHEGAATVHFLDASATALAYCERNLQRNAPHCRGEYSKGDALHLLHDLRDAARRYDVVCLDPPAFIKRRKDMAQGLAAYRKINALGMDLVADGGILVTCSCSHLLDAASLVQCVTTAAAKRGRQAHIVWQHGQGADHPIHSAIPETAYLKCVIARISQ